MSVLSDVRILENIYDKVIIIEPFVYDHIQPSSIDLTLDSKLMIPNEQAQEKSINVFDKNIETYYTEQEVEKYILNPGDCVIGQIKETIQLSKNFTGNIFNRNSLIKLGINVGLSSYINPGYRGKLPIVISNIGKFKIELITGMRICQLVISDVSPEPNLDYSTKKDSKYFGETDISLSKLYLDVEFTEYLDKYNKSHNDVIDKDVLVKHFEERIKQKAKNTIDDLSIEEKKNLGLS